MANRSVATLPGFTNKPGPNLPGFPGYKPNYSSPSNPTPPGTRIDTPSGNSKKSNTQKGDKYRGGVKSTPANELTTSTTSQPTQAEKSAQASLVEEIRNKPQSPNLNQVKAARENRTVISGSGQVTQIPDAPSSSARNPTPPGTVITPQPQQEYGLGSSVYGEDVLLVGQGQKSFTVSRGGYSAPMSSVYGEGMSYEYYNYTPESKRDYSSQASYEKPKSTVQQFYEFYNKPQVKVLKAVGFTDENIYKAKQGIKWAVDPFGINKVKSNTFSEFNEFGINALGFMATDFRDNPLTYELTWGAGKLVGFGFKGVTIASKTIKNSKYFKSVSPYISRSLKGSKVVGLGSEFTFTESSFKLGISKASKRALTTGAKVTVGGGLLAYQSIEVTNAAIATGDIDAAAGVVGTSIGRGAAFGFGYGSGARSSEKLFVPREISRDPLTRTLTSKSGVKTLVTKEGQFELGTYELTSYQPPRYAKYQSKASEFLGMKPKEVMISSERIDVARPPKGYAYVMKEGKIYGTMTPEGEIIQGGEAVFITNKVGSKSVKAYAITGGSEAFNINKYDNELVNIEKDILTRGLGKKTKGATVVDTFGEYSEKQYFRGSLSDQYLFKVRKEAGSTIFDTRKAPGKRVNRLATITSIEEVQQEKQAVQFEFIKDKFDVYKTETAFGDITKSNTARGRRRIETIKDITFSQKDPIFMDEDVTVIGNRLVKPKQVSKQSMAGLQQVSASSASAMPKASTKVPSSIKSIQSAEAFESYPKMVGGYGKGTSLYKGGSVMQDELVEPLSFNIKQPTTTTTSQVNYFETPTYNIKTLSFEQNKNITREINKEVNKEIFRDITKTIDIPLLKTPQKEQQKEQQKIMQKNLLKDLNKTPKGFGFPFPKPTPTTTKEPPFAFWFGRGKRKKKSNKQYSPYDDLVYSPDYTAKELGITRKVKRKNIYSELLAPKLTGVEIRDIPVVID